jgi:hypothetical protein
MRYRSKIVEIEAVQLTWKTWSDVCELLGDIINKENPGRDVTTYSDTCGEASPYIELTIPTLEGDMTAKHGDFIIKGLEGEFYPCKPSVFSAKYELVGDKL